MQDNRAKYVTLVRVSTEDQARSGLGLEAQETAIQNYLDNLPHSPNVIRRFKECESGKKRRVNRPVFDAAVKLAKDEDATLVIAKLDRLSRNMHVITSLMESKVRFVACDMPELDEFSIHIIAAVNERERKLISKRTKEALQAAKARGVRLGNPDAAKISHLGVKSNQDKAQAHAELIYPIIKRIQASGIVSYRGIAGQLNLRKDAETLRGGVWSPQHVKNVLKRCEIGTEYEHMAPLDVIKALGKAPVGFVRMEPTTEEIDQGEWNND
tara:strand:- start:853 stop:1659 length:807 start_codon:yes stop_codon:yes gene_type:complete